MKNQKGFTLIEMVVVVAVIGILAVSAYPRIAGYQERQREQYRSNQQYVINKALKQYYALTGSYCKVNCSAGGTISSADAQALFDELRKKTNVAIEGAADYKYVDASGASGTVELQEIKVEILP